MAQSGQSLPGKQEALSSTLRTHVKKLGRMVYAHAIPASTGEVEMGISLGLAVGPASLPHLHCEL